jgi:glycosyltransferase involved in cell wall biosynthesis
MLSIIILTKNSEKYLNEVLDSTKFANEVIIYDSGSEDKTLEIANHYENVKIFIDKNWEGFGKQKQKAVDKSFNSWVFVLDSDEVITKDLELEILNTIKDSKFKAYEVARLNNYFGKWMKHSGLYPDYSIRLFDKTKCKFNERIVHEKVECENLSKLKNHFLHYAYDSIDTFIKKQNIYSNLGAKPNKLKAIFSPTWTFFKVFIIKRGFLDGWRGFVVAKLYSEYTFWKYIKDKK